MRPNASASSWRIVRDADLRDFERYCTKELVLGYMNALAAGDIDSALAV
ncbi:hypothetical protein [Silanimonas sp.]|nr:hypothetical protein [Silanimonas sp.]MCZ8114326.1 hypothetical protein [Silanimonas sp.]